MPVEGWKNLAQCKCPSFVWHHGQVNGIIRRSQKCFIIQVTQINFHGPLSNEEYDTYRLCNLALGEWMQTQ